jgi:hypothetical protein
VKYYTLKCSALAYVNMAENVIVKTTGNHLGHTTELHSRQAKLVVSEYVDHAATNTMVPPRRVRAEILGALQSSTAPDAVHAVPNISTITTQICRARKQANKYPPLPLAVSDLETIPDEFSKTAASGQFLIHNENHNESEDKRCMIFMSEMGKFVLSTASAWFLDGTFSTAPKFFTQVFIICGKLPNGTVLPGAFMLLPDKEAATYRKVRYARDCVTRFFSLKTLAFSTITGSFLNAFV